MDGLGRIITSATLAIAAASFTLILTGGVGAGRLAPKERLVQVSSLVAAVGARSPAP